MARKVVIIAQIDTYIGARIQELRLVSGLSRQQLAEKIEVTHQQLQKYENGTNRISAGRLAMIAKFLSKPVAYFYEGVENLSEEGEVSSLKTEHQRMCIEVSRNFMKIQKSKHKEAVNYLIKSLMNTEKEH